MISKIILMIFFLVPSIASAMDVEVFQDMFEKIKAKEFDAVEEFLDKNSGTYEKDPEYYVLLLNYSFAKGGQEQALIAKGTPKRGDVEWYAELTHKETGEKAFITSTYKDVELILKAITETREALSFFNNRLDIHFGIVHIASLIKHWDIVGMQLVEILKVSKVNNNEWEWGLINAMQGDSKNFMLDNVQRRVKELFHVQSEEAYNALKAVAEAMIEEYPDVIYGYSNMGIFYLLNNEYDLAEKYLNQAIAIDPEDKIVKGNLEQLEKRRGQ